MGVFFPVSDVEMRADGRWFLKRLFNPTAGAPYRPTIRALEPEPEENWKKSHVRCNGDD